MMRTIRRRALPLLLCAAALPAGAHAQAITLAGGARMYDEDGAGSATMVAVRTEFPIGTWALLEFASSIAERPSRVVRGTASVFEAQVQLPIRLGEVLTPYFGAGAGLGNTYRLSETDEGWQAVLSASVGVRAAITEQLGLVLDARARGIGTGFSGSHLDLTVGLRYRLLPR